MKRYDFEQQHGELGQMRLESDGEWIRYEDHVEAMKRIAGDGAPECDTCNGFIHVHDATGEYRGECPHCTAPSASASPAALTDEQALDISIDLGMVRKDYGGYFVNKLTVEEIMEAIRSLCAESPAAPIAAETEPMAWLFVKSGKKMKIFVRAEASELLDGHYPLFGQSASQLKRHVPQANEQFIAPKLELLAASPAAPAPSASPICTCPSGDGSLRHPCPSHPSASAQQEPANPYAAQGSLEEAWQRGFDGQRGLAAPGSNYDKVWHEGAAARKAYDAGRAAPATASPAEPQSDRTVSQIMEALKNADNERALSFSAKEMRAVLNLWNSAKQLAEGWRNQAAPSASPAALTPTVDSVWQKLDDYAQRRTSPENVADVLNALAASPADQVARGPSSHVLSVNEIAKAAWDEAWQMAYSDGLSAGHPLGCSTLDRDTEWADSEVVAILAANSRSI